MREVMTVICYDYGALLMKPDHAGREADFKAFFPGQAPGVKAVSRPDPVLYREGE